MPVTAKICGLNSPQAVDAALVGGASHVGLVFYPKSPRFVAVPLAAELSRQAAGRAVRVGLFVDASDPAIRGVLDGVDLDLLQLHGNESPARVAEIRARFRLPAMKAIRVHGAEDVRGADAYSDVVDWLLFDAKVPDGLPGGNAVAFDWSLLTGHRWPHPWMLSGGLNAANVGDAVRLTGAKVVDVSSGVESRRGQKDPALVRGFLKQVGCL